MSLEGVVVLAVVLVAASVLGVVRRRRGGVLRETASPAARRLSSADLGRPLGERATLVQFSSAFCRPCVATRHVLAATVADLPDVAHVEIDAESHLELVRRLGVASTPTTLVLDRQGVERRRATGVPRRADVLSAVANVGDG